MTQELINKQIIITITLIFSIILFFQFTNFDMDLQNHLYNFNSQSWLISEKNRVLRKIFYSGFKETFRVCAVIALFLTILSFFKRFVFLHSYKKGLIVFALSLLLVPSLAILKNYTNMPCPYSVEDFGGSYPETKLLSHFPKDLQNSKLKCYPAGHATMGFSLMALYFVFEKQRNKNLGLAIGIIFGALTGGYKMLIGHHFLSHTLVTMFGAWLIILIIAKLVDRYIK